MDDNGWREMFLDAARDGRVNTDMTPSGRLKPVYAPPSPEKEDAYIERMIARDREYERRW